jgi:hypothetical protein
MTTLGNGRWLKELVFPPGTGEYRLVMDGQRMADPLAKENVPDDVTQESKDEKDERIKMPSLWCQTWQFQVRFRVSPLPHVSEANALNRAGGSPESMASQDVHAVGAIGGELRENCCIRLWTH